MTTVGRQKPPHTCIDRQSGEDIPESKPKVWNFTKPDGPSIVEFVQSPLLNVAADGLIPMAKEIAAFEGGKARDGSGPLGTGYGVWIGDSIRERVDVESYFFWHKHNSCATAILRAFLWFNQATMAVIIFSPPYYFSALHLSRLDSRLFYSRSASYWLAI